MKRGDQSGATAVEYAIAASLIALVIAAAVALLSEARGGPPESTIEMGW